MPTIKDRVFLETALRNGQVTPQEISQALAVQAEMERFGIGQQIAAIMAGRGLMPPDAVDQIVKRLEGLGVRCPSCDAVSPLADADRFGNVKCSGCSQRIAFPEGPLPEDAVVEVRWAPKGRGSDSGKHKARPSAPPTTTPTKQSPRENTPSPAVAASQERAFRCGYTKSLFVAPSVTRVRIKNLIGVSPHGTLHRIEETGSFGVLKLLDPALCAKKPVFRKWVDYMQQVQDVPRTATLRPLQHSREGGVDYLIRPYLAEPATSLRARLQTGKPIDEEEALNLMTNILASLGAFHSLRLAHGNLKPENVFLSEGAVQLADPGFGILLEGLLVEERLFRLSDASRYVAPEVLQGGQPDPTSDVYSAGRLLEDLLTLVPACAPQESGQSSKLSRLKELSAQLCAADPGERPLSAKEALRELQKAAKPDGAPRERDPRGARIRKLRRLSPKRLLDPVAAGVVLLITVCIWLSYQGAAWARMRSRDPTSTGIEVSRRLAIKGIEALVTWTAETKPPIGEARAKWGSLVDLFRGTELEETARSAAERSLSRLQDALDPETVVAFQRLAALAAKRDWMQLLSALSEYPEIRSHANWKDLERQIYDGLYNDWGMIYVPGGVVKSHCGSNVSHVRGFLVDAAPARENPTRRVSGGAKDAADSPAHWISFKEAQELASKSKKRLLTVAEWRRLFDYVRSEEPGAQEAAARLEGIGGPFFEWVEATESDQLLKAGYGYCMGGSRIGVPPTHALRRCVEYGYPDVTARFAKSIEGLIDRP